MFQDQCDFIESIVLSPVFTLVVLATGIQKNIMPSFGNNLCIYPYYLYLLLGLFEYNDNHNVFVGCNCSYIYGHSCVFFFTFRLNVCGLASLSEFLAPWRLCATLKVSCSLTPDTPEGLMLKRGVRTALLKTTKGHSAAPVEHTNLVYEAQVHRQAADEGHIVLELSSKCVSELQLKKGSRCEMEVQFQLDRLWFCQMHQAVDHLTDLHTVLPDLSNCCVPVSTTRQTDLNNKQQIALNFILGKCEASKVAAPLLIYGPFGTGKTHCLASAAIQLALQPKTKVLICTYTNR